MSMHAMNLGLPKASLIAEPKGNEFLYHLRSVRKDKHTNVTELKMKKVIDTDDCKIYHQGKLLAVTSTQELEMLIRAATTNTFKMVEVRTENEHYYAAIDEDLLNREYAGVWTDSKSRVTAFVQYVNGTYWAVNNQRLMHLDLEIQGPKLQLNSQDSIRYINRHPEQFTGTSCQVVLFK